MSLPLIRSTDGSAIATTWAYRQLLSARNTSLVQYGATVGTGSTGSVTVTLPISYASTSSYVITATMGDAPAAQFYATQISNNQFTVGWSSGSAGAHNIMWITAGT